MEFEGPLPKRAILLHNPDNRYFDRPLPISEASTVYQSHLWMLPDNVALAPNRLEECGGFEAFKGIRADALDWLRKKRGILCNKVSMFCSEFNLHKGYAFGQNPSAVKEIFLDQLVTTYRDRFD